MGSGIASVSPAQISLASDLAVVQEHPVLAYQTGAAMVAAGASAANDFGNSFMSVEASRSVSNRTARLIGAAVTWYAALGMDETPLAETMKGGLWRIPMDGPAAKKKQEFSPLQRRFNDFLVKENPLYAWSEVGLKTCFELSGVEWTNNPEPGSSQTPMVRVPQVMAVNSTVAALSDIVSTAFGVNASTSEAVAAASTGGPLAAEWVYRNQLTTDGVNVQKMAHTIASWPTAVVLGATSSLALMLAISPLKALAITAGPTLSSALFSATKIAGIAAAARLAYEIAQKDLTLFFAPAAGSMALFEKIDKSTPSPTEKIAMPAQAEERPWQVIVSALAFVCGTAFAGRVTSAMAALAHIDTVGALVVDTCAGEVLSYFKRAGIPISSSQLVTGSLIPLALLSKTPIPSSILTKILIGWTVGAPLVGLTANSIVGVREGRAKIEDEATAIDLGSVGSTELTSKGISLFTRFAALSGLALPAGVSGLLGLGSLAGGLYFTNREIGAQGQGDSNRIARQYLEMAKILVERAPVIGDLAQFADGLYGFSTGRSWWTHAEVSPLEAGLDCAMGVGGLLLAVGPVRNWSRSLIQWAGLSNGGSAAVSSVGSATLSLTRPTSLLARVFSNRVYKEYQTADQTIEGLIRDQLRSSFNGAGALKRIWETPGREALASRLHSLSRKWREGERCERAIAHLAEKGINSAAATQALKTWTGTPSTGTFPTIHRFLATHSGSLPNAVYHDARMAGRGRWESLMLARSAEREAYRPDNLKKIAGALPDLFRSEANQFMTKRGARGRAAQVVGGIRVIASEFFCPTFTPAIMREGARALAPTAFGRHTLSLGQGLMADSGAAFLGLRGLSKAMG